MSALLEALNRHDDHALAISDVDGDHGWGAIRSSAAAAAGRLAGDAALRSVGPEDDAGPRIGLLVSPGHRWLATLIAIWRAGMVAVPLSPRYPDRELADLLDDAGAAALVHDAANHRELGLRRLPVEDLLADPTGAAPTATAPEPLAMLLYTSGTTGRPKGVRLSHSQLAHQARLLVEAWDLSSRRALMHALPLHHMHGIAIALLPALVAGMSARMLPRFDAETIWNAFDGVDTFMGVPTMYHRLLETYDRATAETRIGWREAASSLGLCTSGSAALPVTLAERWQEVTGRIPLERYGMTEIGVGCSNPLDPDARRRGWVGRPLPTVEARIVDEASGEIGAGPGMLEVRGPSVFDGYWRRPDATAEAFHDGWFVTGDVAERDPDGVIKLHGRRSVDILKSGGYKLSALEIEEHLRDHEAVAEVAVVGLPDETWGQIVAAVVVPRRDANIDEVTMRSWLGDRLADYKIPRVWAFRDALPKNALGKVLKPDLTASLR